ncbi:hypothetical protein PUN4_740008 [Paraburkholderia unamae]|nr:hypothetical protein PUN4_740008 [Paraburkholderia unamae]
MIWQLRHMAECNQRTNCYETSVTGQEARAQPEIAKQGVSGVLHDPWEKVTEEFGNSLGALRLADFIKRQKVWICERNGRSIDAAPRETFADHRYYGKRIRPASIERQMSDNF